VLNRIKQIPHNLALFIFGTLYVWLVIEPRLIYPCFGIILKDAPKFVMGWPFLKNVMSLPGGFVVYIAGFLSQGYYYSWLGTVIFVLCVLLLCEIFRRHLITAGCSRSTLLTSIPAILLFLICSRYKHPLPACLTVSLGLLGSLIYETLPIRRWTSRVLTYCLMAALIFWWASTGGLLLFLCMTVIYGIFLHKHLGFSLFVPLVSVIIVWCLAQYVFLIPPAEAFLSLTPASKIITTGMKTFSRVLIVVLYVYVPLSVVLLLLVEKVLSKLKTNRKAPSKVTKEKQVSVVSEQKTRPFALLRNATVFSLPTVLVIVGLHFSYDPMDKSSVLAHDYFLHRQWDKILELSDSLPKGKSNSCINHDVIRALYHTDRLPHDMFHFPQTQQGLLFTQEKMSSLAQFKLCDTFMELGHVNMAEKLASEILAVREHLGMVIEKIVWINIIKGQHRTARTYLNALKKDLVYGCTAHSLLSSLDNMKPDQAAYVKRISSYLHEKEHPGTGEDSVEQILTGLLVQNPQNKMAFEYLMASYLLTGKVDKIAGTIDRLADLGYKAIPVLYEEAILIYVGSVPQEQRANLPRFKISPETIKRYQAFIRIRNTMKPHNRQAVLQRLILEFGSSYFFYFTFGCVGLV